MRFIPLVYLECIVLKIRQDKRVINNAIEPLNSVIRKATKKRKRFPTDDSAKKVIYLAIKEAAKKWIMPVRNWNPALKRFIIEFEHRLTEYI